MPVSGLITPFQFLSLPEKMPHRSSSFNAMLCACPGIVCGVVVPVTAGASTTGIAIDVTTYGIWISGPSVRARPVLLYDVTWYVVSAASLMAK